MRLPRSVRAILSPQTKRIEKKLAAQRSGDSTTASPAQGSAPVRKDEAWIVTDGAAGHESQATAVAEALGLPFKVMRVRAMGVTRLLPPTLRIYLPPKLLLSSVDSSAPLQPPWPRLIISSGGKSAPVALAVKRLSDAQTFALHIQDPRTARARFDLIAAPAHDRLAGENVMATAGSLHRITPARLEEASKSFRSRIEHLPPPRVAVLLGGDSRAYSFPAERGAALGKKLAACARETGGSLLLTASRRTSPEALAALIDAIANVPHFVWDGTGDNPYFGFLAVAEAIVVTEDSVNMTSEAVSTGKPVYVQSLPGRSRRLARFHAAMRERGFTRPFEGRLESWSSTPPNDTEAVASAVRRALGLESGT
jgi:mitochondrial fission protein ELM1